MFVWLYLIPAFYISSFATYTHSRVPQNSVLVERISTPSSHRALNMASGMVLERPDPPIFSLSSDVLQEILIFRVNNKPPVLRDVKSISQVCRHWREIVVDWPSLWGRVISLDELNQVRDDWRTEVLHREKTSALHIFGILEDIRMLDFVLSLMDTQWSRIRRLELDIIASLPAQADDRWRTILRPAPLLQSFVVDIHRAPYAAITSSQKPLFGGHAPQLNTFIPSAIDYNFQGSSGWTSTLRRLELTSMHPFTISQLLEALKCMQQLECLQLNPNGFRGNLNDIYQFTKSPHVRLPRLIYIHMDYGRFWSAISLLDHIYPAPGCALDISIRGVEIPTEERVGEFQQVVSRYTENYYGLGIATDLHLGMSSSYFSISDPDPGIRRMCISCRFPGFIVPDFLCFFTSNGFSNVKHLLLSTDSDCVDDNIIKFISCFPSLQRLNILPTTIKYIYDWYRTSGDSTTPFPLLHTLQISAETDVEDFESRVIFEFLVWRHDIGVPIGMLQLVGCRWDKFNLDFLEDIKGLRVVWTAHCRKDSYIYVCGSGKPEQLDFRRHACKGMVYRLERNYVRK